MTETEALSKMIAPGTPRHGKWRGGVIQIIITRACNLSCYNCTQGSNLGGKPMMMTLEQFETAVKSLKRYFGVVGVFGGNPALHPKFPELCRILREHVSYEQRGLWCNNPMTEENGKAMRATFNPHHSNLNCHTDREAYARFRKWWPESMPFGHDRDSRHAPVHLAMKDVKEYAGPENEGKRWDLISGCDLNQHWSAAIGVFRGQVRAWFCEVAAAQAMLHEHEPDYPDTGTPIHEDGMSDWPHGNGTGIKGYWWQRPMGFFADQVRKHCHECAVPLRGYGEISQNPDGVEHTSPTHASIYKPKKKDRKVEVVTELVQLGTKRVGRVIDYVANGSK